MKAVPVIALVVSFGLVLGMFTAIGLTDHIGGSDTGLSSEVEDVANESEDAEIDPDDAGETGFLSFTISGIKGVIGIFNIVIFLPSTLNSIGMPMDFARFIGHGAQLVVALGIINLVLGDGLR